MPNFTNLIPKFSQWISNKCQSNSVFFDKNYQINFIFIQKISKICKHKLRAIDEITGCARRFFTQRSTCYVDRGGWLAFSFSVHLGFSCPGWGDRAGSRRGARCLPGANGAARGGDF